MNKAPAARIALYAILIFVAGAVTGALVAPIIGRSFMQMPDSHQMSHVMLARLRSGLDLTDEQMAKIKPLVENACGDMETIHHETMQRVLNRIAETNAKISVFLTPEQRVKFEKMQAEHRMQIRHFHHPGPPAELPPP